MNLDYQNIISKSNTIDAHLTKTFIENLTNLNCSTSARTFQTRFFMDVLSSGNDASNKIIVRSVNQNMELSKSEHDSAF